jgi:alkylation response protein AidB-like acyl-CoA dehydrogenase
VNTPLEWLDALLPSINADRALRGSWKDLAAGLAQAVHTGSAADVRSAWLRTVRRRLVEQQPPANADPGVWQAGAQFLAGYYDLDLREATGTGHGAMIVKHAPDHLAAFWTQRLRNGALVGIAATEAHGGSRIQEITTSAREGTDGQWRITGEKCWVSRLVESDAFVAFVRDPRGGISAVVVPADAEGLSRHVIEPAGLAGWTWGILRFDHVAVDASTALLGEPGAGLKIFRTHFAQFRPLVTACALGAACGVFDNVRTTLISKRATGVLPRIRDNALIELGMAWAQINAGLLLTFHAARTGAAQEPGSDLAARVGKAYGVETACTVVGRLAPLVGAAGFQRHHPIMKARLDLAALQYADGIHDSLYRSGGSELLREGHFIVEQVAQTPMAA